MKGVYLFCLLIFVSCTERFSEKELNGCYTSIGYKNCLDTIQLNPNWIYHRTVYDKGGKLLLEMDGKWSLERNSIIHFVSFFLNLDRDLVKFPELLEDTLGGRGGLLESKNGVVQFCVGYLAGENCYQKTN